MKKRQSVFVWGLISIGLLAVAIILFAVGITITKPNLGALMNNAFRFFGIFSVTSFMNTLLSYLFLVFLLMLFIGYMILYKKTHRYTSIIFAILTVVFTFFGLIYDVSLLGDITRMITGGIPNGFVTYVIGFFVFNIGVIAYVVLFIIDEYTDHCMIQDSYYTVTKDELALQKIDLRDDPIDQPLVKPIVTPAEYQAEKVKTLEEKPMEKPEIKNERPTTKKFPVIKKNETQNKKGSRRALTKKEVRELVNKEEAKNKKESKAKPKKVETKKSEPKNSSNKKAETKKPKTKKPSKGKTYGYYSKLLNKPFDSITELNKAEAEYKKSIKVSNKK